MGRFKHINGARGVTLLGFGFLSLVMGLAYVGPIAVIPPIPPGLSVLDRYVPLAWWGVLWAAVGVFLIVGAFLQNQSMGLSLFSGICAVWGCSYTWQFIREMSDSGHSRQWVSAALLWCLVVACLGVARLVNSPVDVNKKAVLEVHDDKG